MRDYKAIHAKRYKVSLLTKSRLERNEAHVHDFKYAYKEKTVHFHGIKPCFLRSCVQYQYDLLVSKCLCGEVISTKSVDISHENMRKMSVWAILYWLFDTLEQN